MSKTYYSSLSGMLAASYGLQNSSHNIANMQSYGFRRNDVFYASLGNGQGDSHQGQGVRVTGSSTNFSPGTYTEADSASSLAILGSGFFVIRLANNDLVYTRDGSFTFKDGVLIDRHTNGLVQGYDAGGKLVPIYEQGPKNSPGKASKDVYIKGDFVPRKLDKKTDDPNSPPNPTPPNPTPPNPTPPTPTPGPIEPNKETDKKPNPDPTPSTKDNEKKLYEDVLFSLEKIYDAQGNAHKVQFKFTENLDNPAQKNKTWKLSEITCEDGAPISANMFQELDFSGTTNNVIEFSINEQAPVRIHFGSAFDGTDYAVQYQDQTGRNDTTQIAIYKNDGYGIGSQLNATFNDNGLLTYNYDNGTHIDGIHISLARFDDMENNLIPSENNFFRTKNNYGIHYGHPNHNGFEPIQTQKLEHSNVDSTAEFANIVVLQRMFQACSQIMDIDKQILDELRNKT